MKNLLLAICCLLSGQSFAQKTKTENLIIVTLDGMRWQEIFGGIDSQIVVNHKFTRDSASVTGLLVHPKEMSDVKSYFHSSGKPLRYRDSYMVTD